MGHVESLVQIMDIVLHQRCKISVGLHALVKRARNSIGELVGAGAARQGGGHGH